MSHYISHGVAVTNPASSTVEREAREASYMSTYASSLPPWRRVEHVIGAQLATSSPTPSSRWLYDSSAASPAPLPVGDTPTELAAAAVDVDRLPDAPAHNDGSGLTAVVNRFASLEGVDRQTHIVQPQKATPQCDYSQPVLRR